MTLDELISKWCEGGHPRWDFVRIPKKVLKRINIPEDSKRFLNEAGLMEEMYYSGTINKNLPRLPDAYPQTKSMPASFARYRLLGLSHTFTDTGFMCLDEEVGGRVVNILVPEESIQTEEDIEVRFVNSSFPQFAECRMVWGDYYEAMKRSYFLLASEQEQEYVRLFEEAIRRIDPAAIEDERNELSLELVRLRSGWGY